MHQAQAPQQQHEGRAEQVRSGRAAKANARFLEGKDGGWLKGPPHPLPSAFAQVPPALEKLRLSVGGWWPVHMSYSK